MGGILSAEFHSHLTCYDTVHPSYFEIIHYFRGRHSSTRSLVLLCWHTHEHFQRTPRMVTAIAMTSTMRQEMAVVDMVLLLCSNRRFGMSNFNIMQYKIDNS